MTDPAAGTVAARLTREQRDRIEAAMAVQMMHESELGAFELEAVRELTRRVI